MITTVEEAQHELNVALEECLAEFGDDAPDEGSAAADLFAGLSYDWPAAIAAEVARMEFGFVPAGSSEAIVNAFREAVGHDDVLDW